MDTEQKTLETLPFHFHENAVRVVEIDDEPWFVAKDVCDSIELDDVRRAVERLDEDEKQNGVILHSGQARNMWLVNEPGVYSLVLRSNMPKSREFKRWLTHEVLPQIRNTGRFEIPEKADDVIRASELGEIMGMTQETVLKYGKRIGVVSGIGRWGTIYTYEQAFAIVNIGHGKSGKTILSTVSAKLKEYFRGLVAEKRELSQSDIVRLIENQNKLIDMTLKLLERKK